MTRTRTSLALICAFAAAFVLGIYLVKAIAGGIGLARSDDAGAPAAGAVSPAPPDPLPAAAATGLGRPTDASATSTTTEPVAAGSSDASHLEAATGPVAPTRSDASPPAGAPPPPAVVHVPTIDTQVLIDTGLAAGPLAIALQPLVALLAGLALVRRRAPWLAASRAVAVVSIIAADLLVLGPAIWTGSITWTGFLIAVLVHAGQVRYPDALHRSSSSSTPGTAGGVTALLIGLLVAGCCRVSSPAGAPAAPGPLDKVADVALPMAKGYLCSQPAPPSWAPDAPWMAALWAAAQALVCTPAAPAPTPPAVAGEVELAPGGGR